MKNHPVLHRLFFAIRPDPATARRTCAFAEPFAAGAPLLPPERQHMTIAITNDYTDYPGGAEETLRTIGDGILADPFEISLDRIVASRRSVALRPSSRIPAFSALADMLGARMVSAGLQRHGYRCSPHQTLFYRQGEPWQRRTEGFTWDVREFVLVHSEVGNSRHTIRGRWPLIAQPRLL
jgi:2'-5' RNA ligase